MRLYGVLCASLFLFSCDIWNDKAASEVAEDRPSIQTNTVALLNGYVQTNTVVNPNPKSSSNNEAILLSVGPGKVAGNLGSENAKVSTDGKFVVFESAASNLVAGDTNQMIDVFLVEVATGVVTLVSKNTAGEMGNGNSSEPAISSDGGVVVFKSFASNLVENDSNGTTDIFLRYTRTGETIRVSLATSGQESNNQSGRPSVSGDGSRVVFESIASNLVEGDSNTVSDVFLHQVSTGATTRVSVNSRGASGDFNQVDLSSSNPVISLDGKSVAFESYAANLVEGDTNEQSDVFVFEVGSGHVSRVSLSSDSKQGGSGSHSPSISGNGELVTFVSDASNLVAGDTNGSMDVFLHNRTNSVTSLVSNNSDGKSAGDVSLQASVDGSGKFVVFESFASDLIESDHNSAGDIFIKDLASGEITRVSNSFNGELNSFSRAPSTSSGGELIAFHSFATNISPQDTNIVSDVVLVDFARESSE